MTKSRRGFPINTPVKFLTFNVFCLFIYMYIFFLVGLRSSFFLLNCGLLYTGGFFLILVFLNSIIATHFSLNFCRAPVL